MNYMRVLFLLLLPLCTYAQEVSQKTSMSKYLGINEIESIFVVHYETMDQSKIHKKISHIRTKGILSKIEEGLNKLSSEGEIQKSWTEDIPTIKVFILCKNGKYSVMDIWNHRINRDGGYGMVDYEDEKNLVKLIEDN